MDALKMNPIYIVDELERENGNMKHTVEQI